MEERIRKLIDLQRQLVEQNTLLTEAIKNRDPKEKIDAIYNDIQKLLEQIKALR